VSGWLHVPPAQQGPNARPHGSVVVVDVVWAGTHRPSLPHVPTTKAVNGSWPEAYAQFQ